MFQDRFKSEPVEDESYFMTVLRYIHQNPVKAKMAATAEEYRWSSYNDYVKTGGFANTKYALKIMGTDEFIRFNNIENEDCLLEKKSKTYRMNDTDAKEIMRRLFGFDTVNAFQNLSQEDKTEKIKKLLTEGLSIRQISRLTGSSKGFVEKCGK